VAVSNSSVMLLMRTPHCSNAATASCVFALETAMAKVHATRVESEDVHSLPTPVELVKFQLHETARM
jgi:hypothetical protein